MAIHRVGVSEGTCHHQLARFGRHPDTWHMAMEAMQGATSLLPSMWRVEQHTGGGGTWWLPQLPTIALKVAHVLGRVGNMVQEGLAMVPAWQQQQWGVWVVSLRGQLKATKEQLSDNLLEGLAKMMHPLHIFDVRHQPPTNNAQHHNPLHYLTTCVGLQPGKPPSGMHKLESGHYSVYLGMAQAPKMQAEAAEALAGPSTSTSPPAGAVASPTSSATQGRATAPVMELLHRLVLWAYVGPPPACPSDQQMVACHVCGNPWCLNPKHLYWATKARNTMNNRDVHQAIVDEAASSRGGLVELWHPCPLP
jgi:hypothetical protein